VKPDLGAFVLDIQEVQSRIDRAFYVPLFLMISYGQQRGQPPTAREIEERHEEKMLVLGPVLESFIDELLDPLVDRVFAMMDRAGLIPPAPPDLEGVSLQTEYTSMLAQAQKMQGVGLLDRFMLSAGPLAQAFPDVAVCIDGKRVLQEYRDALGVHPDIIRSPEDVAAIQQAQAQAQQQQVMTDQFATTAQAAKAASEATLADGTTVLDRLAGRG
jgi:hypothetical protein